MKRKTVYDQRSIRKRKIKKGSRAVDQNWHTQHNHDVTQQSAHVYLLCRFIKAIFVLCNLYRNGIRLYIRNTYLYHFGRWERRKLVSFENEGITSRTIQMEKNSMYIFVECTQEITGHLIFFAFNAFDSNISHWQHVNGWTPFNQKVFGFSHL